MFTDRGRTDRRTGWNQYTLPKLRLQGILYKYWLHERVTWDISPQENQCRPRRSRGLHWFSRGDNFPCYPLVQSIYLYYTECYLIIKYMHRLHYVWIQNNPGQVNVWICVSYSVNLNAHTTPVRIYDEPYVHKFCEVDIFFGISPVVKQYHPLLSSITY